MVHRVISLKYRPQNFDELTGQNHIVLSLKGAIKSARIGQAFLFAGPRGVGKTTMARIFAKSLNCITGPTITPCQECQSCREITLSRSMDVVEIDGASNRGIDEIRNLREGVRYSPIYSRKKIYIIDEVHMLTTEAFNALLKTLEEPPPSVIFILATTNQTKLPATIISRCQRFVFKRLSLKEITSRLRQLAEKEKIKISDTALHYVAIRADGSIRDGESILEQLMSFVEDEITEQDVFKLIGFLGNSFYFELMNTLIAKDWTQAITTLNRGIEEGADPVEIYRGLLNHLRATLLLKTGLAEEFIELSNEESEILKMTPINKDKIVNLLEIGLKFEETIRRSMNIRIALELLLSQLIISLSEPETRPPNQAPANASSPAKDIKEKIFVALQNNSPKLAGIIHQAELKSDGNNITISVASEFSQSQLINNQKSLETLINKELKGDYKLNIQLKPGTKKDTDIINTIKVMFDGEEVR